MFKYQNALLIKQNIILGDKLRYTYLCYQDLLSSKQIENFIYSILVTTKSTATQLISREKFYEIMDALLDSNRIIARSKELVEEMIEFSKEKMKLKVYLKEKVKFYCLEIDQVEENINELVKQHDTQVVTNKVLWETHEKIHKKVRQIENSKNKDKEKFCKNCLKWFRDKDNFAWSCKRHAGEWNHFSYWCCGNQVQNSQGCVISYHITDDSEEIKVAERVEEFCISCGKKGHVFNKCPKDPNCLHIFQSARGEIDRIDRVRSKKKPKTPRKIKSIRVVKK